MKRALVILVHLATVSLCLAQRPFEDEIREFKKRDSIQMPPENAILFVGSSSFRLWKDAQDAFPRHQIINRGFGGSTLSDVIRYQEDIVFPYSPKQIVIYCGENDIASGASADEVLTRFKNLFTNIRERLPEVHVVFVSMKPSPSRQKFRNEIEKGNALIRSYLKDHKRTRYIDVYSAMLDIRKRPKPELFVSDSLHMNQNGYAIWREAIRPALRN